MQLFFEKNIRFGQAKHFSFFKTFLAWKERYASLNLLFPQVETKFGFLMFPGRKNRFLSLMGITSGAFWLSKSGIILTMVSLCIFKKASTGFFVTMTLCLKEKKTNFFNIYVFLMFSVEKKFFRVSRVPIRVFVDPRVFQTLCVF